MMIKNERQYRVTKNAAERFAKALDTLKKRPAGADGLHPGIAKMQVDAVKGQLADLEAQMREYENLKAGGFQLERLDVVEEVPVLLIKARIAQGLTQRELASRVGLKEQQIQRYEADEYASASFSRIKEVADALAS